MQTNLTRCIVANKVKGEQQGVNAMGQAANITCADGAPSCFGLESQTQMASMRAQQVKLKGMLMHR